VKGISESRQQLTIVVGLEDPTKTPGKNSVKKWRSDHLDGAKGRFCTAQRVFN
jgi:hypothetical protein